MTTVSDAFPSNWLKAADLKNKTIKVTIDKVIFEEIGQNKRTPQAAVLRTMAGSIMLRPVELLSEQDIPEAPPIPSRRPSSVRAHVTQLPAGPR